MHKIRVGLSITVVTCLALFVTLAPSDSHAAALTLSVSGVGTGPGNDPLLDVNSWFVFQDEIGFRDQAASQGETATTTITLASGDSTKRRVKVTAQCCIDSNTAKTLAVHGLDLALTAITGGVTTAPGIGPMNRCMLANGDLIDCPDRSKATQVVDLTGGASLNLSLSVTAHGAVTPGRYLVTVTAASDDTPQAIANNVWPVLNVLPALPVDNAELPLQCPSSPTGSQDITAVSVGSPPQVVNSVPPLEVLILRPLIHQLFTAKAKTPTQTVFAFGINALSTLAAWQVTIMAPPTPLPPTMTSITLNNSAGWDKIMLALNSGACPHVVPPVMPVGVNSSGTMTVDLRTATTLLLQRQACANWIGAICADKSRFDNMAAFSETNFAYLFGGRSVTIDWFFSRGE